MASINVNEKEKLAQAQASTAPVTNSAIAASPATTTGGGLKGVSENTANKLNQYSQGYTPGSSVQAAQDYLNGIINKKPVANQQLSDLYDRVMNREDFSYDLNGDMLYQQYRDQYMNAGRQAMMDTMGNAAALTGGYGNSYATTAGNQAYQSYLQQMNNAVPQLYQMALSRYNQEGDALANQYNMAYGIYRDELGDWENERAQANADYWNQYNADYAQHQNMLNYWNNLAQQENSNYYAERDYAYNLAMAIIAQRNMPSDEILAAAGMTKADAKALGARTSSGGGGGSKKNSGSSTSSTVSSNAVGIIPGATSFSVSGNSNLGSIASGATSNRKPNVNTSVGNIKKLQGYKK